MEEAQGKDEDLINDEHLYKMSCFSQRYSSDYMKPAKCQTNN